ncbi:MAG TPA: hypothetical protein GXZ74_09525 [Tissierellia bacterium]|nr:hypothetical protein [Tissierellia bacterium]
MDFLIYAIVNFAIFIIALAFHFGVKERGDVNMLDQFDQYQRKAKKRQIMQDFYHQGDYTPDDQRERKPIDIFANQPSAGRRPQTVTGQLAKQVGEQNPALAKAFRELQSEFQRKRIEKR